MVSNTHCRERAGNRGTANAGESGQTRIASVATPFGVVADPDRAAVG
jgi:hypothetical protein